MKKGLTNLVLNFFLGAVVIVIMSYLFDDFYVRNFGVAFLVAVILTLLNTFVKPILTVIALPITILSLGLFQLIVNGFVLKIATIILSPDFQIESFGSTVIAALCISILNSILGIGKIDD